MLEGLWSRVKSNHFLQMAICCILPVFLILGLQFLGITNQWAYGFAIILCVGSHLVMMYFSSKEGKSCH